MKARFIAIWQAVRVRFEPFHDKGLLLKALRLKRETLGEECGWIALTAAVAPLVCHVKRPRFDAMHRIADQIDECLETLEGLEGDFVPRKLMRRATKLLVKASRFCF